jgi:hypothetical protein
MLSSEGALATTEHRTPYCNGPWVVPLRRIASVLRIIQQAVTLTVSPVISFEMGLQRGRYYSFICAFRLERRRVLSL